MQDEVKPKKRYIRRFFKAGFNVRKWVFYDQIVANANLIVGSIKTLYSLDKKPIQKETFEEAVARQQITEEQLKSRKRFFFWYSIFYACFGIGLIVYCSYLFSQHTLAAIFVLIMGILMFAYAYRESMWYMQICCRKLGCGFKDWLKFIFAGRKA